MQRDEIKKGIERTWGDTPVGNMCLLIVEKILSVKAEAASALTYRNLLDLTGGDEITPELVSALNVLTTSEFAILDVSGWFIDEDDESHELTAEQFEAVVRRNFLIHPILGQPVEDAASKVCPFFSLREGVLSEAAS